MQIAPKVNLVAVPDQHIMRLTSNNVYLVGEREAVLIDTGMGGDDSNQMIIDAVKNLSLDLSYIILSHSHEDHTGGVKALQAATGAKIATHRANIAALEKAAADKAAKSENKDKPAEEPIKVDFVLDDDSVMEVDGVKLEVVFTPGHSAEDICLFIKDSGTLFTGDLIVGTGTVVVNDMVDYMASLRRLLKLDSVRICPGHGPIIDDAKAKIQEYIEHRVMREDQIIANLKDGEKTSWELVQAMYSDVDPRLHKMAEKNVLGHMSVLLHDGRVIKIDKESGATYKLAR